MTDHNQNMENYMKKIHRRRMWRYQVDCEMLEYEHHGCNKARYSYLPNKRPGRSYFFSRWCFSAKGTVNGLLDYKLIVQ